MKGFARCTLAKYFDQMCNLHFKEYKILLSSIRSNTTSNLFKSDISFYKKKTDPLKATSTDESKLLKHCESHESFIVLRNDCKCSKFHETLENKKREAALNKIDTGLNVLNRNKDKKVIVEKNFKIDSDILKMYI
jgi:hypothetical protein